MKKSKSRATVRRDTSNSRMKSPLFGHCPVWGPSRNISTTRLIRYPKQYEPNLGALRPAIPEVVGKFLDCGNLERGFARVRCDECQHEYLDQEQAGDWRPEVAG
jgi:Transposase zinc-binding domain